jgi:hypothetical protein
MVVQFQEFLLVIVGSVVLSLVVLAVISPRMRDVRRLALVGVAGAIGILVWNVGLNVTNSGGLNVDSSILGLSVQDVGSGVLAFIGVFLALTLGTRGLPTSRILTAAAVVGLATIFVDRFA